MVGVALTVPIVVVLGKKTTFIYVNMVLAVLSVVFFFILATTMTGWWIMLVMPILSAYYRPHETD